MTTPPNCELWNATRSERMARRLLRAQGWLQTGLGLLARPPLSVDEAIWLTPAGSIHTWGMRYALHVLFLDETHTVLQVARNVSPGKLVRAPQGTRSVIEFSAQSPVVVHAGDRLEFRPAPKDAK